ncbi:MAG: hypothetical protein WCO57_15985 [Verrucomicrobiota bacterium]
MNTHNHNKIMDLVIQAEGTTDYTDYTERNEAIAISWRLTRRVAERNRSADL